MTTQDQDRYAVLHASTLELIQRLRHLVEDFPDPESATYGHHGDLGYIRQKLAELMEDEK